MVGTEKAIESRVLSYAEVAEGISPAAKSDGPVVPLHDGVVCEPPEGVRGPDPNVAKANEGSPGLLEGSIPETILAEEEDR